MQIQEVLAIVKRYIDPPNPGKGKSIATAALLAGLFGPIGVGVHLRSLAQFGWCVLGGMGLTWLTGWREEVALVVTSLIWGPARVWLDNRPVAPIAKHPAEPQAATNGMAGPNAVVPA